MFIKTISKQLRFSCLFLLSFYALCATAAADDSFVVKGISIRGLQRIPLATAMTYLPIHAGQTITASDTALIIQDLYQTGFFSNVTLSREGDDLIVQVVERPTIALIKITGNKQIKTDDLLKALKQTGISEGGEYDQAVLDQMRNALLNEYHKTGRYDATVDITASQQARNRQSVDIKINEGKIAKIKEIRIVGNKVFKTSQLLKNFSLGKKPWWAVLSSKDEYSEDKLEQDLKSLQEFYLDRGYLRFKVLSQDVEMTKDKRSVVVTLTVSEGAQYRVEGYKLTGNLLGQEAALAKYIQIKPGQIFSRKKVVGTDTAIERFYGDKGYASTQTIAEPNVNDVAHTVFITFNVQTGQRVYIRQVNYAGNTATGDEVLRRETRQMEGGVYSVSQQDESKRRLNNLGYLENIESKTAPVTNKTDQMDLNYNVKESSSTTASAQVGYSDAYGFLYGANLTQKNFKGTGNTVSIGFNNSEDVQNYNFTYFNPYYTDSGISRGFSVYFQKVQPDQTNVASYTMDSYGGMVNYRLPMSEYDYLSFGYGYEYMDIQANDASQQINDFVTQHGDHFNNLKVTMGWTHNSYDRVILPTRGFNQWLGVEVGLPGLPESLDYYRFNYDAAYYHPIAKGFILELNTDLGYGNGYGDFSGELPFFKNFYAGGMGTVRGYETSTLGPKDSLGNALGGNVLTTASVNLIVPNPISEDHLRTSLFLDAGNVYQDSLDLSEIRYSSGLEIDWASPMGLLKISFGDAWNSKPGDNLQFINFSIGTSF